LGSEGALSQTTALHLTSISLRAQLFHDTLDQRLCPFHARQNRLQIERGL
jgi:hypothetical protein